MRFDVVHETRHRLRLKTAPGLYSRPECQAIARDILAVLGAGRVVVSYYTGSITITSPGPAALGETLFFLKSYQPPVIRGPQPRQPQEEGGPAPAVLLTGLFRRAVTPKFLKPYLTAFLALPYLWRGVKELLKGRLNVEVLDGTAILTAMLRRDFPTASNIMYLLTAGDVLAHWTRKKSRQRLARDLALRVDEVWLKLADGQEIMKPFTEVAIGDMVIARAGQAVPVDGRVVSGEALINDSFMTGEPLAVLKRPGSYVYAGTVIEEGEVVVEVTRKDADTRLKSIIDFIGRAEDLKAGLQSRAERLADAIVPFSFGLSLVTFLVTGNLAKASTAFMVDYSCAIKLATPLAILAAMREGAVRGGLIFKGGRFLEQMAQADTIVFDKTGTLTQATPSVREITPCGDYTWREVLKLAACLEEHFPHPVARAVVRRAADEGLDHQEEHATVNYIAAHGIVSSWNGQRVIIGSRHFVADDEGIDLAAAAKVEDWAAREGLSLLYLSHGNRLAGVLAIEDPIREEAAEVIGYLRRLGFKRVIMLTGDGPGPAGAVAEKLGITEYVSQILPHQKAG